MTKVKITILGSNGEAEEVRYMTAEDIRKVYPLGEAGFDDIDDALDILSEDCPGAFANSEGKVSYDFEIFEE